MFEVFQVALAVEYYWFEKRFQLESEMEREKKKLQQQSRRGLEWLLSVL